MRNYCGKCGTPLPIDSAADNCWRHGGPALTPESQIRCPFYKEIIMAEAKKCRYCGEFLRPPDPALTPKVATPNESTAALPTRSPEASRNRNNGSRNILLAWMGRHPLLSLGLIGALSLVADIARLDFIRQPSTTAAET